MMSSIYFTALISNAGMLVLRNGRKLAPFLGILFSPWLNLKVNYMPVGGLAP